MDFLGLSHFFIKLREMFVAKKEISGLVQKGDDGISVESVIQTTTSTADRGINIVTVKLSDGTSSSFNVRNGSKGAKGDMGNTPIIQAGIATSLASNASPTVTSTTSGDTTTFNFGIPKGDTSKIETPTFTDTVTTYTTLDTANTAAETASSAIKSKVSIFTILSNIKRSFSAIVQSLKILATNIGAINGITDSLTSTSSSIAASAVSVKTLNNKIIELNSKLYDVSSALPVSGYEVYGDSYIHRSTFGQVDLYVNITCVTIQDTWHTIAMLPAGFEPNIHRRIEAHIVNDDGTFNPIGCYIYSNGNINVYNSRDTGQYKIEVYGSYIMSS